jgi:hypothetical protein
MYKGSSDNPKLPEELPDWLSQSLPGAWIYRFALSFNADLLFWGSSRPHNTAKAEVAHSCVDHLWLASRWPVTQAVIRSA